MDKTYSPKEIESSWYERWERAGYFKPGRQGTPFCIMLPPPNVTGSLHMGHGFQHTLMDTLTRYHRMCGDRTLWQPGTDHAGISTQLVVENRLQHQGINKKDLSREAFIERVWEWKNESGQEIYKQMRSMGSSPDWSRERFTLDEGLSLAVQKVFIQLYEEGLIYRGTRLVNWDTKLGTAVSDLEVISEEEDGFLWYIRYPLVDSTDEHLVVATTRPETLLGDMAVAVNPDDPRYQAWIGKTVQLPLCDRNIPIIADPDIDPEFGTGCVKVTPAHDFQDYQIGKRHKLDILNILTKKGTINKQAPVKYQGMTSLKAREQILEDLKALNLLDKVMPHKLKVPRGEKSNTVIEPLLTDQWYVKVEVLAKPAIEVVQQEKIRFIPDSWTKVYYQWMENIEDWCISRQLLWGHRIPAWYDNQGRVFVGYSEEDVRFKYHLSSDLPLKQDEDVLDTWFSSALWPFSTLGWPEQTTELQVFYPTSVLITGFDIIFFWVARMIMMGLKFTGEVPFKEVLITGLIRDGHGQKMSKSKGNVLDPLDIVNGISLKALIQKRTANLMLTTKVDSIKKQTEKEFPTGIPAYGTDALRFTYCALASFGRNIRFDLMRVEGYRNFCNKLWNASRFVLQHVKEISGEWGDEALQYTPADLWIQSCLQHVIKQVHQHFKSYRFDHLANTLYDFVWHTYCDWYIEFSKTVLYDNKALPALKRGTQSTLLSVLDTILRLLHPIMPFITEEIGQHFSQATGQERDTLMLSPYPTYDAAKVQKSLETEFEWLKSLIQAVRTIRSEMGIAPHIPVPLLLRHTTASLQKSILKLQDILISLCKLNGISLLEDETPVPVSASAVIGEMEVLIPMAGLIDKEAELARLARELAKLDKDLIFIDGQLNNPNFVSRAPKEILASAQAKREQALLSIEKLKTHQKRIEQL